MYDDIFIHNACKIIFILSWTALKKFLTYLTQPVLSHRIGFILGKLQLICNFIFQHYIFRENILQCSY